MTFKYAVLTATVAIIAAVFTICFAQPLHAFANSHHVFACVNDRPLLETVDAVWSAEATNYATFHIGSEYFVVENLPLEYVKYSALCARMP